MTDDIVKLTAYFAERERAGDRFLADAILDVYARRHIATSVMLRGIASFGPRKIVRSDVTLSQSEDPPVAITAVDTADAIAAVRDEVTALTVRGLITVERGRPLHASAHPGDEHTALTVFVGRQQRIGRTPAYLEICDILYGTGFDCATVFLGVDGTVDGQRRRARFLSRNVDVPVQIVGVGTVTHAQAATAKLVGLLPDPLMMFERVRICKRDGRVLSPPHDPSLGTFVKLTVYTSEDSRHAGSPIHRVLVRRLRESAEVSGATVLRGLWGFHDSQGPHGDRLFALGRHVPVATVVIDTAAAIAHSFELIDELTGDHGLVTSEFVPERTAIDRHLHGR